MAIPRDRNVNEDFAAAERARKAKNDEKDQTEQDEDSQQTEAEVDTTILNSKLAELPKALVMDELVMLIERMQSVVHIIQPVARFLVEDINTGDSGAAEFQAVVLARFPNTPAEHNPRVLLLVDNVSVLELMQINVGRYISMGGERISVDVATEVVANWLLEDGPDSMTWSDLLEGLEDVLTRAADIKSVVTSWQAAAQSSLVSLDEMIKSHRQGTG
jgi:hypothetical protein